MRVDIFFMGAALVTAAFFVAYEMGQQKKAAEYVPPDDITQVPRITLPAQFAFRVMPDLGLFPKKSDTSDDCEGNGNG